MFRIVRTSTLGALHAQVATLTAEAAEVPGLREKVVTATGSATRAEAVAGQQLRELAQAHADRIAAETQAREAGEAAARTEADARRELEEIRQDVARLKDAATDTATGESVRGAIAYRLLRDLYEDAHTRGLVPMRPFDLVAAVLGFDKPSTDAAPAAQGVRPYWRTCRNCGTARPLNRYPEGFQTCTFCVEERDAVEAGTN